jgi:hypothetical protein
MVASYVWGVIVIMTYSSGCCGRVTSECTEPSGIGVISRRGLQQAAR